MTVKNDIDISVVIPVYGSPESLSPLTERIIATLKEIGVAFEIIYVDDRCPKNSWQILSDLHSKYPQLKCIRLSQNFGQHQAIGAGLQRAKGNWHVVMDCDLQDPPEFISDLYRKAQETGADIVFGRRRTRGHGVWKRLSSDLYLWILRYFNKRIVVKNMGNFTLFSKKVTQAYLNVHDVHRDHLFTLSWLGFNAVIVDYEHRPRLLGSSSYTLGDLIRLAVRGILFQTTTLLNCIIIVGFMFALTGMGVATFFLVRYLLGSEPPLGWTSMIVAVLFFSGVSMFSMGIIGLYIGVIFEQVKGRPLYVVDEEIE